MSTPPPPPPGHNPLPPFQQPGHQPPPGYQNYGSPQAVGPQRTNGMSIASLVLSLVNIIPCFWFLPLPALLGVIFGFVGKGQIAKNPNAKGRGMAIAGIVIGFVFLAVAIIFWLYITTSDNCTRTSTGFECT